MLKGRILGSVNLRISCVGGTFQAPDEKRPVLILPRDSILEYLEPVVLMSNPGGRGPMVAKTARQKGNTADAVRRAAGPGR